MPTSNILDGYRDIELHTLIKIREFMNQGWIQFKEKALFF